MESLDGKFRGFWAAITRKIEPSIVHPRIIAVVTDKDKFIKFNFSPSSTNCFPDAHQYPSSEYQKEIEKRFDEAIDKTNANNWNYSKAEVVEKAYSELLENYEPNYKWINVIETLESK